MSSSVDHVLLVHGAFADGSGWRGVYTHLRQEGFQVTVVQNPLTTLADDVAATHRAVALAGGKVMLVGHSYGGCVITEAGLHPEVAGLVYIAAFAPDAGESVSSLIKPAPGSEPPPFAPPEGGFLSLDPARFPAAFAADVDADTAAFMAVSQAPWGDAAVNGRVSEPAWRSRPSWYLVATDDLMIPPANQREMAGRAGATVREVPGSHAIYVSNPKAVADLIAEAARACPG